MSFPYYRLYQCAVLPPERALILWRDEGKRPLEELSWDEYRLLPAVLQNLQRMELEPSELSKLRQAYKFSVAHHAVLRRVACGAISLLQKAGVPVILLKGVYLSEIVHQDPGLRPCFDVDLLVPQELATLALEAMAAEGWKSLGDVSVEERLYHAATLQKQNVQVDLHWSLLHEARNPEDDHIFWQQATLQEVLGLEVETLCPTHHLLLFLLAATREPLHLARYLLDLRFLLQHFEAEINWSELRALLLERGLASRLSYLPPGELELHGLGPLPKLGLWDRLWSWSTRHVHDGSGERAYALFPILDYYRHHYRRNGLSLWSYLARRLKVRDWKSGVQRSLKKFRRLLPNS